MRALRLVWGGALAAIVVAWALLYPLLPFGRDQGVFAWVGDVVLAGGVPYRDAWDVKGPLTHLVFAAAELAFGRHEWSVRVLDLLLITAALSVAARAESRAAGRFSAWGAALFVLLYASGGFWHTAQPDGWAALLVFVLLALLVDESAAAVGGRSGLALGCLVGGLVALKSVFGVFLVPVLLAAAFGGWSTRQRVAWVASLAAGVVLPMAVIVAWFAAHGAVADLLQTQVAFNLGVHASAHHRSVVAQAWALWSAPMFHGAMLLAWPVVALGLVRLRATSWRSVAVVGATFVAGVVVVVLQNKFYPYHWWPVLPPFCLAFGWGCAGLRRLGEGAAARADGERRADTRRPLVVAGTACALVVTAIAGADALSAVSPVWRLWRGEVDRTAFGRAFVTSDFSYTGQRAVADLLSRPNTGRGPVLVWGFDPLVNFLSGRPSPTRFGFHYPLTRGATNPFEQQFRALFMQELASQPPDVIVVLDNDRNNLQPLTSAQLMAGFPEFDAFVRRGYALVGRVEDRAVYQLWARRLAAAARAEGGAGAAR